MSEEQKKKGWSRRKFLVRSSIGVGLVIGTGYVTKSIWRRYLTEFANTVESPYLGGKDPSLWFELTIYNEVIIHSTKVEMGQGAFTGLAQIAAEELDFDVSRIKVQHAESIDDNVDSFGTGGSTTISSLWVPLREMAATMREMVRLQAAKRMNTTIDKIQIGNGFVTDGIESFSYGEIASKVAEWEEVDTPELKPVSAFKYVGQPVPRVDLQEKISGAPIYGLDAEFPDMVYGAVLRPDTIDASLTKADTSEAEQMPGVIQVVKEDDFIGVVANTYTQAENAKNAIQTEWTPKKLWQTADIVEQTKVGMGKASSIQKSGSPGRYLEGEGLITAEYSSPIGAHAQLEPNAAVAHVTQEGVEIKISTQVVDITRKEVAKRLGLKKDQVNIIPTFLGGGFGRRLHTPHAMQAAVLSKAVGRPVKIVFNRQEEFQNDTFRPPTHHVLKAKLKDDGMIEALEHNVSSGAVAVGSPLLPAILPKFMGSDLGAWRGGMIQYSGIPNYEVISWFVELPFATSWWRSLGLLANTFAIESFMDELAVKSGKDPVQFRLDQIDDSAAGKRLKGVIRAAAEKANWTNEVSEGRAMGFACSTDVNTPCAQVVEVSIENEEIKVHKVTCAIDPGLVINPDQVKAQCEGAIIMGMSASMFEEMQVEDSQLKPIIYGPYKMAMLKHAPREIDVVLLETTGQPGGVGEPPLGPIGAAIANAVFRLTGKRLRNMPLNLNA